MRLSFVAFLLLVACGAACAQAAFPRVVSAEPASAKAGDIITVTGENLGTNMVAKVYLTDSKTDLQVEVTEQTATTIKFKVPAKATGRMAVAVLTADKDPKLMESPVKVTVQAPMP